MNFFSLPKDILFRLINVSFCQFLFDDLALVVQFSEANFEYFYSQCQMRVQTFAGVWLGISIHFYRLSPILYYFLRASRSILANYCAHHLPHLQFRFHQQNPQHLVLPFQNHPRLHIHCDLCVCIHQRRLKLLFIDLKAATHRHMSKPQRFSSSWVWMEPISLCRCGASSQAICKTSHATYSDPKTQLILFNRHTGSCAFKWCYGRGERAFLRIWVRPFCRSEKHQNST